MPSAWRDIEARGALALVAMVPLGRPTQEHGECSCENEHEKRRIDDTGPGIPDAARERIFEPFFRVPGTTQPGTGIGLATVRRILEAHGGRISVDDTEGPGSSFLIWLPLADAEHAVSLPSPLVRAPSRRGRGCEARA